MDIPCELTSPDDPSKARVKYACPGCKAPLASPMADAGQTDRCPDCGTVFRVPGVEAFAAHRAAIEGKRRTEEQKRQDEIDARRKAEADRVRAAEAQRQQSAAYRAWENQERRRNVAAIRSAAAGYYGDWIRAVAIILCAVGPIVFFVGMIMNTAHEGVHNIGMLQNRAMTVAAGLAMVGTGLILQGMHIIIVHLSAIRARLDASPPIADRASEGGSGPESRPSSPV